MAIFMLIGMILVWFLGTAATFVIVRSRPDEYSSFADFMGSLIFWPIMLPAFMVRAALRAGAFHGTQYIEWTKRRNSPPVLRAGADNGLYE